MMADDKVELAVIANDISYIKVSIDKINGRLEHEYVTKAELDIVDKKYELTQRVVYGMVGLMLIAMFGAFIKLVILQ